MYLYKINIIDGNSYIIRNKKNNVEEFLKELFNTDVVIYELAEYLSNDIFISTNIAIVSKNIVSVEYACEKVN